MAQVSVPDLARYDALYLSPHADDAVLACAGRILAGRARGERALVLVLFGSEVERLARTVAERGLDVSAAGLVPAARRRRRASFRSIAFERSAEDEEAFNGVMRVLADVGPRVRARHVYVPLGVGGHADHRLTHEAALQIFVDEPGRNLFLYEERPEAFAPGAVRVRLGLLGARLPPGAAQAARRAGLARYLLRVQSAAGWRGDFRGLADRVRSLGAAAGEWRAARLWNSQKAFGPRLQPIVQASDAEVERDVKALWSSLLAQGRRRGHERWRGAAAAYSRALGAVPHAERYWLVLPALPGAVEPARRDEMAAAGAR
jgi:LmbE family N-acetylglucosaminyl deacetylase